MAAIATRQCGTAISKSNMKKSLTLVAAAFFFTIALAQQAVSFRAPTDAFRVNSTATALASRSGPFLKVQLNQHLMWQPKSQSGTSEVTGFSVGIAARNDKGHWDTERVSATVPVSVRLRPGETQEVPPATLLIPIDNISSFEGKWLVIAMHHIDHGGQARTYAHSEKLTIK